MTRRIAKTVTKKIVTKKTVTNKTVTKGRLALTALAMTLMIGAAFQVQAQDKAPDASSSQPKVTVAQVGKQAPDFKLFDQYAKSHSLSEFKGKVVVMEWTNPGCPFVVRHYNEGTMVNLQKKYGAKSEDFVWLRINSTNIGHRDYLNAKQTQEWAKENNVNGLVLDDSQGKVGHMYDAKTTPHLFIVNQAGILVYSGAIDDDPRGKKSGDKRENYVDAILTGWTDNGKIEPTANDSYGCSIKYKKSVSNK